MRIIKDGDVILDGSKTRYEAEKLAFAKLEQIENWEAKTGVSAIDFLNRFLEGGMWAYHKKANFIGKIDFNIEEAMNCKTVKVERVIE